MACDVLQEQQAGTHQAAARGEHNAYCTGPPPSRTGCQICMHMCTQDKQRRLACSGSIRHPTPYTCGRCTCQATR